MIQDTRCIASTSENILVPASMLMNQPTRHVTHCEPCENDHVLVECLQNGCEECFDVLFARYWKLVFTIAWKILRQRTDAEDIVQEVFLTIHIQRNRYDAGRGSVKTWIAQFAHFKALLRRRYLQSREQQKLDDLAEFESGLEHHGPRDSPLERAAFVEECLASINPRQRRTIELIHFDGYTLLEAAAVLKESLPNTRNLYYRGMKSLRSQLRVGRAEPAPHHRRSIGDLPDGAESLAFGTDV
jgi:RNA polymerase sigma-70 factor (ECF subfamily)